MNEEMSYIHQLINSLIASTYFITTFTFKWQAIRDKFEKLNCDLKSAANSGDQGKDVFLTDLLHDIFTTVAEIQLLSDHCSDGSYNGGKLLMKSDIEKASSKLDLLIKRISEVYASEIRMHYNSLVVAKPGEGSSQDDMRLYIKDIILRLGVEDLDMKETALSAINEILHDDEKNVMILVGDVDGSIPLLIRLLEFDNVIIQEGASEAILIVAGFDSYKGALVNSGVIGPLVWILEAGSKLGKIRAAWALKNLTQNSENMWSVSANGGVTALLKLTGDNESSTELIYPSCGVLQNLISVIEIKRFMVEEGVVSIFLNLLASKEEVTRVRAIEFLISIASEDDEIKAQIVREGATEKIRDFLNPTSSHSWKEREVALRAMKQWCFSSRNSIIFLIKKGLLGWVLFIFNEGETPILEVALKAMLQLCEASDEAKKAMGDSGFMPVVVKLLEAKSYKVCEMAAELLVKLVSVHKNRKRFIDEQKNVNQILVLLNPSEDKPKRFLLPLLTALTHSNSGRRKIATSGYVKHLEWLAETDVVEAKKIVKKISGNRFKNLLNGVWSL